MNATYPFSAFFLMATIVAGAIGDHALQSAEIAHYSFDNTFNDSSASMNNLTVASGTPGYTSTAGEFAFGSAGLDVDGASNEWLALNSPVSFSSTDAWTIGFWARRRAGATSDAGMIVGKQGSTNDFIWLTGAFSGFRFRSSTGNTGDFTAVKDSTLRHYALVADGAGNLDLYIDGVFSETKSGNTSFNLENVAHAYTGTAHSLDGNIDELFVFNEALSATQVSNLQQFNNINGVPEPSTWAIWGLLGLVATAFVYLQRKPARCSK